MGESVLDFLGLFLRGATAGWCHGGGRGCGRWGYQGGGGHSDTAASMASLLGASHDVRQHVEGGWGTGYSSVLRMVIRALVEETGREWG